MYTFPTTIEDGTLEITVHVRYEVDRRGDVTSLDAFYDRTGAISISDRLLDSYHDQLVREARKDLWAREDAVLRR